MDSLHDRYAKHETKVDSNNNIVHKESLPLWQQIKEDFSVPAKRDPAFGGFLELFFNYPGLIAIVHHRIAHRLYKSGFKALGRIIMGITQFITNIDLHPAAFVGRRVFIDHGIGIVIGETAQIGNDVTIYQGVSLGGVSLEKTKRHPTVLNNVIIGAGAKVLGDIVIGENAKIGANSVVTKDVPDNATAVGIPARIINKEQMAKKPTTIKLPDIDKKMFEYLLLRMRVLEEKLDSKDTSNKEEILKDKEKELDSVCKEIVKILEKDR